MKARVFFFTVFLFIGSLLPNSDLHELSKIPVLLQHFQQHQQSTSAQLSFADFLKMHYASAADDQAAAEHDSLPFKQMGNSAYDYFVSTPSLQHPAYFKVLNPLKQTPFLNVAPTNLFKGAIWQPPQIS